MKKITLFILFCTVFALSYSQIIITQADMPNAGDTLRVSNSADTLNPLLTGTNYTWDYSYLAPGSQWLNKFDAPSTFVSPFNLIFYSASYGQAQYTPDTIPLLGKPDNAYNFLKKSSTRYKQVGSGLMLNAAPIPFYYTSHDTIYCFPLSYGNSDSSDAKFGLPIPNIGYYGQNIHRENVVDGWGTLITPYGTFPTLRVKSTVAIRDTFADTSGLGFAFPRPLQYEFKWLTQGGKIPYLQVNATDVSGNPVVNTIAYRDSMRAGVIQIGINELAETDFGLQVFPNPANEYAFVQYTLEVPLHVKIELLDMSGRKVSTLISSKQASGNHLEIVNLRNLNVQSGTYFLCLYAGKGKAVRRIILGGKN